VYIVFCGATYSIIYLLQDLLRRLHIAYIHIHTYVYMLQDLLKESAKIAAQSKNAKSAKDRKVVAANAKKLQEVCMR
jgi:hypothetical protein